MAELVARLRRIGPPAHDRRGAAGRVPVRRRRFQRRGRDRWRACPTDPVNTCSIAFDDPAFDESRVRPAGGAIATAPTTSSIRVESDDFDLIDTLARALRRALRRQLGHSHLPRLPAGAQACDRGAVGRRRRRDLRRLPALPPAPDGRADARARCRSACAGRCSACWAACIPRPIGRRACSAPRRPSRRWPAIRSRRTSTACRSCATPMRDACSAGFKRELAGYNAQRGVPAPRRAAPVPTTRWR